MTVSPTPLPDLPQHFAEALFFRQGDLETYLLRPEDFGPLADGIGRLRAEAFLEVSPLGPQSSDLDGRDCHYWHLLVWDRRTGRVAGAQRLSFSRWQPSHWDGLCSYLEHCFPGLASEMGSAGHHYLEVGRIFVTPLHRADFRILPTLLRSAAMLARATDHRWTLGLMSFCQIGQPQALVQRFLERLRLPPFCARHLDLPRPRHPVPGLQETAAPSPADLGCTTYRELEQQLRQIDERFRVPGLVRLNAGLSGARVAGFSIARDFNQIIEILMACDGWEPAPAQSHPALVLPHRSPWLPQGP
jgi:hypothetical protein